MKYFSVGIGEGAVSKAPDIIRTTALGSCVGITLYDPVLKIGGMVHIMLPKPFSTRSFDEKNPYKFADIGIRELLNEMIRNKADQKRIVARIYGGAYMFPEMKTTIMQIGKRNIESTIETLKQLNIQVIYQDTGGTKGRTLEFVLETGEVSIWQGNSGKS